MILKFKVIGQSIMACPAAELAEGTIDTICAEFTFSAEWKGLVKTAFFMRGNDGPYQSPISSNGTIAAAEGHLNFGAGLWQVSVAGERIENGRVVQRLTTAVAHFVVAGSIVDPGGQPFPGVPPTGQGEPGKPALISDNGTWLIYDPYVEDYVDTGLPSRGETGADGAPGKDGKDGRDGKDGYTPIKGIDYFDGEKGEKGDQGVPGKDGADGKNGSNGLDGRNGVDGIDGRDGRNGIDGTSVTITSINESTESGGTSIVTFSDGNELHVRNGIDGLDGSGGSGEVPDDLILVGDTPREDTKLIVNEDGEEIELLTRDDIEGVYIKPDGGIPESDLSEDVKAKLNTGGSAIAVDAELSGISENPVQNKVLKNILDNKVNGTGGEIKSIQTTEIELAPSMESIPGMYACVGDGTQMIDGNTYTVSIDGVEHTAVAVNTNLGVGVGSDLSKLATFDFAVGDWFVLSTQSIVIVGSEGETPTLAVVGESVEYVPLDKRITTHLLEFDTIESYGDHVWQGTGLHFSGTNVYIPTEKYALSLEKADEFWSDYLLKISFDDNTFVLPYKRENWQIYATWGNYVMGDNTAFRLDAGLSRDGVASITKHDSRVMTYSEYDDGSYGVNFEVEKAIESVVNNMFTSALGVGF